ncbi:dihydroneopterin aldolase [Rhodothalassium salexigens DSM 2132]|uniref:7,8-dihydroneopterin aldolase n=1 Tax=Rhodothalassium salexigens DSM 2132 TaxID=1188247 RepID=A0A4V6NQS9_RHOSA|nr:dihydroneopterin aldolase [Rhodothalassium salexigens]MBB4211950.1 dihydroneopterin aldolase [Rhodothalassium salexigens DSM 2132]MBK1638612.1 dihydroneopterin aldolase [Rhodothalassium salexigens DSM 2132]TCP33466.1 dihydroneopterin aldolase [Rhodothalassium salexigens DSM 2132]
MPDRYRTPKVTPLHYADAARGVRHVFVRDFRTDASIGVFAHEQNNPQPISISVDLSVEETDDPGDRLENVVCYNKVVEGIRTILAAGHINLVETLADRIAQLCLADHRVQTARVRIEKLQVVEDAAGVGVEIERHKSPVKN